MNLNCGSVVTVAAEGEPVPLYPRLNREWQAVLLSFSSRDKEHGQYVLELDLRVQANNSSTSGQAAPVVTRRWLCHSILFLPRSDTSLSEIHQVSLAAKNKCAYLLKMAPSPGYSIGAAAGQQMQKSRWLRVMAPSHKFSSLPINPWRFKRVRPHIWRGRPGRNRGRRGRCDEDAGQAKYQNTRRRRDSASECNTCFDGVRRISMRTAASSRSGTQNTPPSLPHLAADSWQFGRERRINTRPTTQSIVIDHPASARFMLKLVSTAETLCCEIIHDLVSV